MTKSQPVLIPVPDEAEIARFASEALRSTSILKDKGLVETLLNSTHPKTLFLKSLPTNAKILDLGAGDGSLVHFKTYLTPSRNDLKFYAFSLEKGEHFNSYDGYEIRDWNAERPSFGGMKFDAIVCGHFIEHVPDFESAVSWCASRLSDRGRIYLEWPSEYSLAAPTKEKLHAHGLMVQVGNFYDDATHMQLPDRQKVIGALKLSGMVIEQQGYIRFPLLESELFYFYKDSPFSYPLQAAYWSRTRWCQYIIASNERSERA